MKALCFGSLNIDFIYRVPHFVGKGETLAAEGLNIFSGGKGLNQSVALARAGAETFHAGAVGEDGLFLTEQLAAAGVDVTHVRVLSQVRTGHAIIQNDREGDNCILLFGGANRVITEEQIEATLSAFSAGDHLILQNEINNVPLIMEKAHARGMKLVLNPSPMEEQLLSWPLSLVDIFLLNEVEAAQLLGPAAGGREGEALARAVGESFPGALVVLTLGEKGAFCLEKGRLYYQPAYPVKPVDTTGAGDTFTGFFLSALMRGRSLEEALQLAAKAAAIAVTRPGASPSIPTLEEVLAWQPCGEPSPAIREGSGR